MSDVTTPNGNQADDDDVDVPDTDQPKRRQQELIDEGLEETFPASDPPTPKHIT